jgi:hypothetical protein
MAEETPVLGRPTDYTKELADEICERVCIGESLRQISLLKNMPTERTIYRWLIKHDDFCHEYARAKEFQSDFHAEECLDIVDENRNDWVERENQRTHETYIALNEEAIGRARLRFEARKWLMGKMKPKKYGEMVNIDHTTNEKDINFSNTDAAFLGLMEQIVKFEKDSAGE